MREREREKTRSEDGTRRAHRAQSRAVLTGVYWLTATWILARSGHGFVGTRKNFLRSSSRTIVSLHPAEPPRGSRTNWNEPECTRRFITYFYPLKSRHIFDLKDNNQINSAKFSIFYIAHIKIKKYIFFYIFRFHFLECQKTDQN